MGHRSFLSLLLLNPATVLHTSAYRVIDVDVSHLDEVFEGTVEDLRALLSSHGYRPAQRMHWDEIFVREDEQTFWL